MSDIIDINVTPIVEQVEILVTENLTTVNINTIQQSSDSNNRITAIPAPPYTLNFATKVLTMTAGWQATINNVNVTTGVQTLPAIVDATDLYSRIDLVSLGVNGIFAITQGVESLSIPIKPILPVNNVEAFFINVIGDQISIQQNGRTLYLFPDSDFVNYGINDGNALYIDVSNSEMYYYDEAQNIYYKVSDTSKAPINNPTFTGSVIVPDATTANQAVNLGQLNLQTVLEGGDVSTKGIAIFETNNASVYGYSENVVATIFGIGASNTNNITEFQKDGYLQAAVTHDGKIIGTDATEPNQMVTLGQLETGLDTKLDASLYNDRFKGKFTTLQQLELAFPTANAGDYAQVDAGAGSLVRNYNYDLEDGWILGGTGAGATSTDTLIEGSTNLYFTTARVLSTLLSGISFVTGGAIVSTDSVLVAFGKLQKQITDTVFWTKSGNIISNTGGTSEIVSAGGQIFGNVGGSNFFAQFFRNASSSISVFLGSGLQTSGFLVNALFGAQFINQTRYLFSIGNYNTHTTPLEVNANNVIAIVPIQVPNATAPNEAVNLSQLESENNVYISHEMMSSNPSADLNFIAISGATISTGTNTINNSGVQRFGSSATANSGVNVRTFGTPLRLKGGEVFTYIFNPLTFANTTSRLGFHDSTSSALPANGVYFEYAGNGDLKTVTEDNNVITSATLATLTINTWYKVRFTVNATATSVLFQLFNATGTLIASATQTTNIPNNTRALNICAITTNSGTTATALIDVDFISAKLTLTR